jgi:nicotinamide mononucleotide adenylyltransferase
MKELGRAGIIARFKPLHNGAKLMLEYACKNADYVIIGVGSANKYDLRNPFTFKETKEMLETQDYIKKTPHEIFPLNDYGHIPEYRDGLKWKSEVIEQFGNIDTIVTANPYVTKLLEDNYRIVHPATLIPKHEWVYVKATQVRVAIAKDEDWQKMVPKEVAEYVTMNKLDQRFRTEFGLETLAYTLGKEYWMHENIDEEIKNAQYV